MSIMTSADAQRSTAAPENGRLVTEALKEHFGVETSLEVFQKAFKGDLESRELDRDEISFIDRHHATYEECGEIPCYVARAFKALPIS